MMECPLCGGGTTVYDSRPEVDCINRKRRCLSCNYKFCTIEIETDMLKSMQKPVKAKVDVEGVKKAIWYLNKFLELEGIFGKIGV